MATTTWYINQITNRLYYDRSREAAVRANATSATGWTVGTIAAARYADLANSTERATGTFTTTVVPNATAPTVTIVDSTTAVYVPPNLLVSGVAITFLYEYNGYFPAGNWIFTFPVIAVSGGGDQDGRMGLRVFKASRGAANTFASTTELTAARLVGTTVTNLATATAQNSVVTWTAPAFSLNNEFLIAKIGWEITGAGTNNNRDVLIRFGQSSTLVSPNFRKRSYNIVSK